jgi:hypothetical protein
MPAGLSEPLNLKTQTTRTEIVKSSIHALEFHRAFQLVIKKEAIWCEWD